MKPEVTTAPASTSTQSVVIPTAKRETMYQRLKRLSQEIQWYTDDPKFAWPKD